jgi:hypothetical protein
LISRTVDINSFYNFHAQSKMQAPQIHQKINYLFM